ncbi:Vam6/Vps39-like protein vacuolar protein sorting-associated protein 39, partial [Phenoliferia sp. Uapishka_3]
MHSPFALSELIPPAALGKDAITAIVLNANRVILGTDKGALLVFDLSTASTSTTPPAATLASRHDAFAKQPIEQLGIIKELNALLCLSGGDLTLHSLPSFDHLSSFAAQTRSAASLFVLSTIIRYPPAPPRRSNSSIGHQGPPPPSAPEIHSTLAIACRRKLLIFSWIDGGWNPPKEIALPHQIRGMAFGESEASRKLLAGFSTGEYGIITLPSLSDSVPVKIGGAEQQAVPTLGDCFTPPIPPAVASAAAIAAAGPSVPSGSSLSSYGERFGGLAKATGTSLGGLGGLAKATGLGALANLSLGGNKLEKNGVVSIPRAAGRLKRVTGLKDKGGDPAAWLWGKEWGWAEERKEEEDEVLLVRENIALPLSVSGQPRPVLAGASSPVVAQPSSTSQAIVYPVAADETIVLPPYVFTLLPPLPHPSKATNTPTLSIHSIEALNPIQTLEIPPRKPPSIAEEGQSLVSASSPTDTQALTARLLTVASSPGQSPIVLLTTTPLTSANPNEQTLWIVTMRSWESQIEELGQHGAWEEGVRLVRRSGTGGAELPPRLLRRLAMLHALSLYNERRYDLAIDAFISLEVSPAKVVALFAEPISGKLFIEPAAKEEIFGGRSRDRVEAAIEEEVEAIAAVKQVEDVPAPGTGSPVKSKVKEDDASSIKSMSIRKGGKSWLRDLQGKAEDDGGEGSAEKAALAQQRQAKADAQDFSRSVDVLIRYLTDRRQRYAQALAALVPSVRPAPNKKQFGASAAELFDLPDLPLAELKPEQLALVAQVVDTALFRSYLATKPVMVGPLCRIENWCEVGEVEELLLKAKKYRELLDLYNGKGMHDKAVKLLRQMSEDEDDAEEKVGPTVRYLQKLGSEHVELIFESSRWVFEADRAAGLDIFIADLEEVESLPRYATMKHLDRIGPDVCSKYLEHIIHHLGESAPEFHERLIELYLDSIHKKAAGYAESSSKLLDLLESSTSYRADRILGRLPSEDMYQVRAILLGRLGRHEGALQLYVYQLDDHATAEEYGFYCKRVHESDPTSKIFHILLRIYLRPRASHPLLFGPALSLISSHASSIDAIEVFDLLPPLVALTDIRVFLEKTLRRSGERAREAKFIKEIGRSWVESEEREIVGLEERRVKVTDSRVCPHCNKRLGNSVIAVHSPHGEVTHYQCRDFKSGS